MRKGKLAAFTGGVLLVGMLVGIRQVAAEEPALPNTGLGDASTFIELYKRWQSANPNARIVNLTLEHYGPLSAESVDAAGQVRLDLSSGTVSASVAGLPPGAWELWLLDNRTGSSFPDAGDLAINAGRLRSEENMWLLNAQLALPEGFEPDRAVVTRAGATPVAAPVLLGSASVYDRLRLGLVRLGNRRVETEADIWQLVASGRRVFLTQTFAGNGRTCATCHMESANFTIGPDQIAALPPTDPIFVHERSSDLAASFENKDLLRKLAVFGANVDGYDESRITFRSARNLQALGTQIAAPALPQIVDFTTTGPAASPVERLGWGNDALSLRDFAIGAIVQHLPRTLARRAGSDFRIPTDEELDAMAAFQLSIGRHEEFRLSTLKLLSTPAIQGQRLFLDSGKIGEPGHKNCNACHFNAGGTAALSFNDAAPGFTPVLDGNPRGFNVASGTNVNGLPAVRLFGFPPDGGFGRVPLPNRAFGNLGQVPGADPFPVEEFKSNSIVESADTAPFFHNHVAATLEESIAFYGSDAYRADESIGSPTLGPVPVKISSDPKDPEVLAISTFLRVLNTLENIRSAISAVNRARRAPSVADANELARLARSEASDALRVLNSGSLASNVDLTVSLTRARLLSARTLLDSAAGATSRERVEVALVDALFRLRGARDLLADPATLPDSFRN